MRKLLVPLLQKARQEIASVAGEKKQADLAPIGNKTKPNSAMEKSRQALDTASQLYIEAAEKVALYIDNGDNGGKTKKSELNAIRKLMLGNIKLERSYENELKALELTKEKLAKVPDLDYDKVSLKNG